MLIIYVNYYRTFVVILMWTTLPFTAHSDSDFMTQCLSEVLLPSYKQLTYQLGQIIHEPNIPSFNQIFRLLVTFVQLRTNRTVHYWFCCTVFMLSHMLPLIKSINFKGKYYLHHLPVLTLHWKAVVMRLQHCLSYYTASQSSSIWAKISGTFNFLFTLLYVAWHT